MSTTFSGPCEDGPYDGQMLMHFSKDCVLLGFTPDDTDEPSRVLGCYSFDTTSLVWKWMRAQ